MSKKVLAIIAVPFLLVVGLVAAWAVMIAPGKDLQVAKLEQKYDDAFRRARDKDAKPEDVLAEFQQLKRATKNLTPAQQQELKASTQKASMRMLDEQIRTYASLSEEEKTAFLDEQIDRKEAFVRNSPNNKNAQAGARKWQALTQRQLLEIRRQKLDATTPHERALWDEFLRDFKARRKQRGLQDLDGRGK